MSVSALFGGLAQLARSLTVLVSTCERAATVDEGCAASIETLLVPVTLWINGGIAISAACDKGWVRFFWRETSGLVGVGPVLLRVINNSRYC